MMVTTLLVYKFKLTHASFFTLTAVTIGFERPSYTISEPESGTSMLQVCMILTVGLLGRPVTIEPEWTPDSAQGIE